jgi:hypothetical protein
LTKENVDHNFEKDDMRIDALSPEDVRDRDLWRRIHGAKWPTQVKLDIP